MVISVEDFRTIMFNRFKLIIIQIFSIFVAFLPSVIIFLQKRFITFSDTAKYADVARTWLNTGMYGQSFSFWAMNLKYPFPGVILPVTPFSILTLFKIFGVNDFAVIATSLFYFLLTLVFVFLLSRKVFKSNLVGILSTLTVGFSYDILTYATSGASESPFIFEIVAGAYFISLKKKWATGVAVIFLVLLYFTRSQSFIYIAGLILYYLLQKFSTKKAILYFIFVSIFAYLIDKFLLRVVNGKYFLYSILYRGSTLVSSNISGVATSDSLRGNVIPTVSILSVFKSVFYNIYNFYKLLPQIMNPYLVALFAIGIFKWGKDKKQNSFKASSIFVVITTFLVTAMSIPFFRYLHPVIPFVYIIAIGTLVGIIGQIFKNKKIVIITSLILALFFIVGKTLGIIFLDSRFEKNTYNVDKLPVYVNLSYILRDNTNEDQLIVTNLDTWGSWYGERKTVWFPLKPKQLIDPSTGKIPFDAIYLTNYLIDDQNYYMGDDWREIFNNPDDSKKWTCDGCSEIAKEFIVKDIYSVFASNNYERQDFEAILLVKN